MDLRIFDEIVAYENRTRADANLVASRFIESNQWYVNEKYLEKAFADPAFYLQPDKHRIHGLSRATSVRLARNYILSRKKQDFLSSAADVINIKRSGARLRAFYITNPSHPYTLKIVLDVGRNFWSTMNVGREPDDDRYETIKVLEREVAVRETLLSLKTINIPRIFSTDVQGDAFLVSEEMVMGRRFNDITDMTLYREKVLPQLRDTYLAYGVRYEPIQSFLPSDLSEKVAMLFNERVDGRSFLDALKNVVERNGLAAVSLCHGGLRSSHLAVTNGEVFFLDWKRAHVGLIGLDLLKMPLIYRRLGAMIGNIRDIMTPDLLGDCYRFEDMLTVGFARAILRQPSPRRISRLLRVWHRFAV